MRKIFIATLAVAGVIAPVAGQADEICSIPLAEATLANPQSTDALNDWDGLAFGNQAATVPAGDIYREGTDLEAAWLSRAPNGALRGNVKLQDLGAGVLVNVNFYVNWTYEGSDPTKAQRFASARFVGAQVEYTFGHIAASTIPGSNAQLVTDGGTTGAVNVDSDTIFIDMPLSTDWGSPTEGADLYLIFAESRVLVGSPIALPQPPSPVRHGFVFIADTSEQECNGRA